MKADFVTKAKTCKQHITEMKISTATVAYLHKQQGS